MRALCVISGGMDSATCAYIAKREGYEIVALHFDYDQRTMGKERECFGKICDDLGVAKRFVLDARFIAQIGGSALTDGTLPIRKGAAELGVAVNSASAEIDSAANSKSARLDGQNSIAVNSIDAKIGGQNFTASDFSAGSADATLGVDSARSGCAQSGEILTQGDEISLGGDELSLQGSKILACDDKISSQGGKILVQEGEISLKILAEDDKISSQSNAASSQSDEILSKCAGSEIPSRNFEAMSQSGAQPQQGDKISSKRAEGEIPSQNQSDKIPPQGGESAFSDLPSTYVPFRNGVFLSIAAALAEKERCDAIFIGVVQEDSSGYPDCSASFIGAFERALELGTSRDFHPRIKTPLVHLSKAQIVSLALKIGVPLELTWSCYEREDAACGLCDSCLLRLKGFAGAGAKDKIPYAIEA